MEHFSLYSLVLVLSITANIYAFHRLVLLPYFAEIFYSSEKYFAELIISRRDRGLELLLNEVVKKAEEKRFKFERPKVRVLKRGLGLLVVDGTPAVACASWSLNRILFDRKWFRVDGYSVRRALMAHELGHIVADQTLRIGHPFLEKFKYLSDELFADAFTAFLYSKEDVLSYREPRYSDNFDNFNKEEFMKLDLSIDEARPEEIKINEICSPIANTA